METLKFRHLFCNSLRHNYYNEIFNLHINHHLLQTKRRVKILFFCQLLIKNFRIIE